MDYSWKNIVYEDHNTIAHLQEILNISPVLCKLLAQRNITDYNTAKAFFKPQLKALHNPFLMKDMDIAVETIMQAISTQENILIYGDYDVDGTTAVSLVSAFLRAHYSNIDTYIPDRYKEGYGISKAGIDYAHDNGIKLIIALDCGIKAIDMVSYAKSLGIDFIICDHHRPGNELPEAIAVLDPKRKDCIYPYDELSGCGIGLKLVQALAEKWKLPQSSWKALLDLCALSIGADIVPITGENRILAYHGLKLINENPSMGIAILKESLKKTDKPMSIMDVVFGIGPRINAAGRISHGKLAVNLLTGKDAEQLEKDAELINNQNTERRNLDKNITEEALQMVKNNGEEKKFTTVLYNKDWHKGVIGIVASRLIETHYKPTIIFTEKDGILSGSARSVKGFDIYQALEACSAILEQFGGHKYAAGMTLKAENYSAFKNKFEEVVKNSILPEQLKAEIEVDAIIKLSDITPKFYRILKRFAPFGPANMNPVFVTKNLSDTGQSKKVGEDEKHLRVVVIESETGVNITGIGFNMAHKYELLSNNKSVDIAYHIDENTFNGQTSLQMRILDIKASEV